MASASITEAVNCDRRRAGDPRVCGTCSGYGYCDDSEHTLTIYREMCPRMAGCRSALVHRVLWLVLDDVARTDDGNRLHLGVDAIARLLNCRRESVMSALTWLRDAGIVRPRNSAAAIPATAP